LRCFLRHTFDLRPVSDEAVLGKGTWSERESSPAALLPLVLAAPGQKPARRARALLVLLGAV